MLKYYRILRFLRLTDNCGLTTVEQESYQPTVWAHLFLEMLFLEYVRLF